MKRLFSEELRLVGQGHHHFSGSFFQHTLASQPGVEAWVYGPVDEIFFPVGDFREELLAFLHIEMAGAAGANGAAIVVQIYIVIECNFQQ